MLLKYKCQRPAPMRQEVVLAKFQPHASQMHFKWAEIRYCLQFTVNSNRLCQWRGLNCYNMDYILELLNLTRVGRKRIIWIIRVKISR